MTAKFSASDAVAEFTAGPVGATVGAFFGITHLLCNHFELDDRGRLTGDVISPIVWGPKKAAAAQRFCTDNGVALQGSYFYADGDEDVALMACGG